MKSKVLEKVLRGLIAALGGGIGLAVALWAAKLFRFADPDAVIPIAVPLVLYPLTILLFAAIAFIFSRAILAEGVRLTRAVMNRMDELPTGMLITALGGIILGFVVAALLSEILHFLGDSMFTTAMAILLYVGFGAMGLTLGLRRSAELVRFFGIRDGAKPHAFTRKKHARRHSTVRLLDTSALIDGRVAEVARVGFLEGELVVPAFVVEELRRMADASDAAKRTKGQRGLNVLETMKNDQSMRFTVDDSPAGSGETDVRLLRLAREKQATVVTCDTALAKAALISGVSAMNIHVLADVMRPSLRAGDVLTAAIAREGKGPGQGVAFLPDGTMLVVENGRSRVGEELEVCVTSVLQTTGGRMVFAKPVE